MPYIAAAMLDKKNETYFNVSGKYLDIISMQTLSLTYPRCPHL